MRIAFSFLLAITLLACRKPARISPYAVPHDRAESIKMHANPNGPSGDAFVGDGQTPERIDGLAVRVATDSSGNLVGYYVERPAPRSASNYEIVPVNVPDGMTKMERR